MARPVVKKDDIEQAAIALFAKGGLAAATIKLIAKAAGVTEGALYRHYKSKDEMAWQLYNRELERLAEPLAAILFNESETASDRLVGAITYMYEFYGKHPDSFAFVLLTQHSFPGRVIHRPEMNVYPMVIRFITDAYDEAGIDADPTLAACMGMGLVLQPLLLHHTGHLPAITEDMVPQVVAAAARAIRFDLN